MTVNAPEINFNEYQKPWKQIAFSFNVAKKANSTLGFLRRNLKYCPQECKKTAYISLVHSTMEYGGIIWDPYTETNINRLEKIQQQAARFITGDYRSREEGSVSDMFVKLELQELKE